MTARYKAEARKGYWILIDTYTGELASSPTTRTNAYSEARYMRGVYGANASNSTVKDNIL
jgi:hypothetical protein